MALTDLPDLSLERLQQMMSAAGVKRLYLKNLAPNDNSKNQPYVSKGELQAFNILPAGEFEFGLTRKGLQNIKAPFPLEWLQPNGTTVSAPHAKLIYYPQYPEVRISGFLRGTDYAPNDLMNTREPGRLLFLGVTSDRRVVGWAAGPNTKLARHIAALQSLQSEGVFRVIPLLGSKADDEVSLLAELLRIHNLGWIPSKRMKSGVVTPYEGSNAIGYTLEAELGISNNGKAEPDIFGWEVKAAKSTNFNMISPSKKMTLLTPEPDGGEYAEMSLADFVKRFGYPDRNGVPDRLNFGGTFRVGSKSPRTGFTTVVDGFDQVAGTMKNLDGKIYLVNDDGVVAMSWSFAKLLSHWNRKHAKAAYFPGEACNDGPASYRYGPKVFLGEGTDFDKLLRAIVLGFAYYDPGIKLEGVSQGGKGKPRSQFRIPWKYVGSLYNKSGWRDL